MVRDGLAVPDPDATEQLEALRTLHDQGTFTTEEFEEKRHEILASTERTGPEGPPASERSAAPADRTTALEAEPTPPAETTGVDGTRPVDGPGTIGDEDASDRRERFAMLRQLYGQDVLTEREYGTKRRELGPDDGREVPGDPKPALAERFETLRGLYDRGLLTEEEYAEKRRALLEEL